MVTIFLLTQTARLSGPFRYLEHVRKVNRKFSRGLWKKVSAPKMGFCQNLKSCWNILTNPIFGAETFFQSPLENFLLALRTCSRCLKGPLNLAVCVSKKIVTIRRTNRIICQEKWKKLRFWKNEAQNGVGIFWQNPIFWTETFFQRPLENFLLALRTCSRYLKGPLNLAVCVSKKIVTIRHTNKKILAKNLKKTWFLRGSLGTTVEGITVTSYRQLPPSKWPNEA